MSGSHVPKVRLIQLPSTLPFWEDSDKAELVDECKGCGLSKGPLVDPLVLADESQDPEVLEIEEEVAPVSVEGDPWSHLNGCCTCNS